jgi:Cys-tRNA(Pro)/Cys-tRNA(Cys) deacylase
MSARGTPAIDILRRAGVPHTVHEYEAGATAGRDRDGRPGYGLEAAAALGVDPRRIFKTLVASVDDRLALAVVPVAAELDLKRLADALGGRRATMAEPAVAERATGYVIGGISPLGGRRALPTVLDASAGDGATLFVSAGRRGLQVELAPADLVRLTSARLAPIARPR